MSASGPWIVEVTDLLDGSITVSEHESESDGHLALRRPRSHAQAVLRRRPGGPIVDQVIHEDHPVQLELVPEHAVFEPARNKLEAVSRLGRLNEGPAETLGPGSKERKSVLVNLSRRIGSTVDPALTKPELGAALAAHMGIAWGPDCWSTGSTLTLVGLNRLLEGAQRLLTDRDAAAPATPEREASLILEVLSRAVPARMEGRACVQEMLAAEYSQWAQDEWAGFYFEFIGLPALVQSLGGGPVRYANTRFDYGLGSAWDLKWHGADRGVAILNDERAIRSCVTERGLGFIVLSGEVDYDAGEHRQWQRELRLSQGKVPRKRAHAPKYVRRSKAAFTPRLLEAFHVADEAHLSEALGRGALRPFSTGRQPNGSPRAPKISLDLDRARSCLLVAERECGEDDRAR